jgi:hypothetical protein
LLAKLFDAMKMPALLALATFGDVTQIKSILCSITQSGQGKQRNLSFVTVTNFNKIYTYMTNTYYCSCAAQRRGQGKSGCHFHGTKLPTVLLKMEMEIQF